MSKCSKVKRPCKICLDTVNQKNGLQCQGACQSWVHYSCLNYTPGKIKDIKNGIIRVTCPCPDCKTIMPKEYRTDQPYSCTNQQCPANRPPKCENMKCPTNINEGPPAPSCPLGKCGTSCKQYSTPQLPNANIPCPMQPCVPLPPARPSPSMSDGCLDPNRCASGCASPNTARPDIPGDVGSAPVSGAASLQAIENMCNTIGLLTSQLNDLMATMQQLSCCDNQPEKNTLGAIFRGLRPGQGPQLEKPCTCRARTKKRLI